MIRGRRVSSPRMHLDTISRKKQAIIVAMGQTCHSHPQSALPPTPPALWQMAPRNKSRTEQTHGTQHQLYPYKPL